MYYCHRLVSSLTGTNLNISSYGFSLLAGVIHKLLLCSWSHNVELIIRLDEFCSFESSWGVYILICPTAEDFHAEMVSNVFNVNI
jgi:hypothetical protein